MSHKPRRRPAVEEEHENHERWLVSYADMITVLMALFIVLYAMSQVDETKYEQLKEGLAVGFGRDASILSGQSTMSSAKGVDEKSTESYQMLMSQLPKEQQATVIKLVDESNQLRIQRAYGDAQAEVERLLATWRKVDRALRKQGLRDDVRATVDERGLVISLVSRHVVFEADVAVLTQRGRRVVDTLAPVLAELSEPIELDGHTNQEPVKPKYFPTDWELSLARAAHVLRRFEEVHQIPANRLRATGFGHTKPLIDPSHRDSQAINKRVDIIVLSQAPAETRALMDEAYAEVRRRAGLDEQPAPGPPPPDDTSDEEIPTAAGRTATDARTDPTGQENQP